MKKWKRKRKRKFRYGESRFLHLSDHQQIGQVNKLIKRIIWIFRRRKKSIHRSKIIFFEKIL